MTVRSALQHTLLSSASPNTAITSRTDQTAAPAPVYVHDIFQEHDTAVIACWLPSAAGVSAFLICAVAAGPEASAQHAVTLTQTRCATLQD